MVRYVPTLGFCCMLLWVSTACAPRHNEPEALSEHGYRIALHVSDTLIFLGASGLSLPLASAIVAKAAIVAAKAVVEAAKAAVATATLNLGFTTILSPIEGIAGIATAQVSDLVGPNSGTLTTVSTLDPSAGRGRGTALWGQRLRHAHLGEAGCAGQTGSRSPGPRQCGPAAEHRQPLRPDRCGVRSWRGSRHSSPPLSRKSTPRWIATKC